MPAVILTRSGMTPCGHPREWENTVIPRHTRTEIPVPVVHNASINKFPILAASFQPVREARTNKDVLRILAFANSVKSNDVGLGVGEVASYIDIGLAKRMIHHHRW